MDWKSDVWVVVLLITALYFTALCILGLYECVLQWAADRWYESPQFCDERVSKPWYVRRAERMHALRSQS